MAIATSNKLLPLLAGAVVLMLVFVFLKSCTGEPEDALVLESVPQAPAPDADSPADTIKTLTANVAAMTAEVQALRKDNDQLRRENQDLLHNRHQIEENVTTRIKRELLSQQKDQESRSRIDAGVLSSLTARVDALSQSLSQRQSGSSGSDIPVGLGLDGIGEGISSSDSLIWIEPLDLVDEPVSTANGNGLLHGINPSQRDLLDTAQQETGNLKQAIDTVHPVYTVPRNATLIGSTAMTALVGRIPVQGQVRDPMPFKVITGVDNLAANGLRVPGVQGMVWSGTAIGDWTLSCVTGRLDSVTFVFQDGTIRTISGDDQTTPGGGAEKPLGWISDAQGIPCITGERKTNAPAFLTQRMGVMALQAAGDAAANAETTTVVSDAGSVTSSVTGELGNYVLGKTLSGGSEEVAKWLQERQAQSFDAVFVPAGTRIAIHVDRELPIDLDTHGRKLSHEISFDPTLRTRLD
ncbi:MAG: TIGR03752 family integrating conjugative element protein [Candidatus Thiodiazotropha endolucinida]|nr:TIGR03752 family integrating conjugative element protein [Candidatus Thiodiazotropha endolucinida]